MTIPIQDPNMVDILIEYATETRSHNIKTYTAEFNPDTGVQQYLDYYSQGFRHDRPDALEVKIKSIEVYHNETPAHKKVIYSSEQSS